MGAPRVEIDLRKIRLNARHLVDLLAARGISVTGVTKGVCGDPGVARAMLAGGVEGLADARVSNVDRLRAAGITCDIAMIRSPMPSEIGQIVASCDASYNTAVGPVAALAAAARHSGKRHEIVLMVEMGDMRDGIVPGDLVRVARAVAGMPGVVLTGIAANFACLGNVAPDAAAMARLFRLALEVEAACDLRLRVVSAGGSANLPWAMDCGRVPRATELRLGEAILLGVEPVSGLPIAGLHTDAFTLVCEVIEVGVKPERVDDGAIPGDTEKGGRGGTRAILALGRQDTDVSGLSFPPGTSFIGATSDHTVLEVADRALQVGDLVRCGMRYASLMRAMAARDVSRIYLHEAMLDVAGPQQDYRAVS